MATLEGGCHYLHYLHHSLAQVNNMQGTQLYPSTENLTKDLLSMAPHIRTRPFPPQSVSPIRKVLWDSYASPSEGRQTENHSHRKLTNLITWTTALSKWIYEPCSVGPPKMDGPWWRVLTKRSPLEKGMENHFSILDLRTPWTVWPNSRFPHNIFQNQPTEGMEQHFCFHNFQRKNLRLGSVILACQSQLYPGSNSIKGLLSCPQFWKPWVRNDRDNTFVKKTKKKNNVI